MADGSSTVDELMELGEKAVEAVAFVGGLYGATLMVRDGMNTIKKWANEAENGQAQPQPQQAQQQSQQQTQQQVEVRDAGHQINIQQPQPQTAADPEKDELKRRLAEMEKLLQQQKPSSSPAQQELPSGSGQQPGSQQQPQWQQHQPQPQRLEVVLKYPESNNSKAGSRSRMKARTRKARKVA